MEKKQYTIEEKDAIGKQLAEIFQLRRSKENRGRFNTGWGNKTPLGVFETVRRLGEMIETGEQIQ